jgi:PAT family beta-lactamase induction signal transducer AmpG
MTNLLATRRGKLTAFFLLYIAEGIPLGFTAVALAAQMRRQGVGPAAIGLFVGSLYLPWSWKWAMGPIVDLIYSDRLGRRRGWIVGCQAMMALTLLAAMPLDVRLQLGLITAIVLVHNLFAATQDVAIDALACGTLEEHERGVANGFMFAGSNLGKAVGGAGALFLSAYLGFQSMFLFVAGAIFSIILLVSVRLKEPQTKNARLQDGAPPGTIRSQVAGYGRAVLRAFFSTRAAAVGLVIALLPAGAYALGLALQSNLAVELGLSDTQIGTLSLVSTLCAAVGCIGGGKISDIFGRRRMLAIYIVASAIPTIALAVVMHRFGRTMPVDPTTGVRAAEPGLLAAFWAATIFYNFAQGLIYGTQMALFMDVCTPAVAATQFTAYMSLQNFVTAYSAWWQGPAIERIGYPTTLFIDGLAGCCCLLLLPWMGKRVGDSVAGADRGPPDPDTILVGGPVRP